jgi:phosphoesterase RecJ-like protein
MLEAQMGVKPFILIDHHEQPATFPEVVYSDTSICSTCEMVFHFAGAMNWLELIDVPTAQAIYCGIMTDTMSFRFPSVSPETHEIAAWLMRKGLKPHVVHENVLDSQRLDRLRLMGYALSECMTVLPEYKAAFIAVTKENIDRFQPQSGDTEGLVNMALSIEGTTIAAFFREDDDCVRISFRSKGTRDVNQMARAHFNGGGHKNAAGARLHESLEHTIRKFIELLQKGEI